MCNDGDIRLCNSIEYCGADLLEGRMEYCLSEVWGTVCNNMWSVSDAKVACIQLGFSTSGIHALYLVFYQKITNFCICNTSSCNLLVLNFLSFI